MPKKPLVEKHDLENAFLAYRSEITDAEDRINPPTCSIWKEISNYLKNIYTAKYLYVYVKQNRGNIWEKLGIEKKNKTSRLDFCNLKDESFQDKTNLSNKSTSASDEDSQIEFSITLSSEEWDLIKPTEK